MSEDPQEHAIATLKRLGPILEVERKLLDALAKLEGADELAVVVLTAAEIGVLMASLASSQQLLLMGGIHEQQKVESDRSDPAGGERS